MKRKLPISKLFFRLLIIANLLFVNTLFSQSLGDYRSNVNTTGNWTDASSWQYHNGTTWVSAINYPGQAGTTTGAVLIQNGDTISVGVSGISTDVMGTLTISGTLTLTGNQSVGGINFGINTLSIIVTPLEGIIDFNDKANLVLPENATIQVTSQNNPNPTPDYKGLDGDCSAQQTIVIGALDYAVCQGNTADTGLTFDDLMATGGTLNATASSNSPVCEGSAINLTGGISNVGWTVISYSWEVNGTTTFSTQNASISSASSAPGSPDYTIKFTVVAKYKSSANVTNTQTIYVIVNDRPAEPTVSGTNTFCANTSPTVASLTVTGTAIQWYATSSGGSALPTTTSLVDGTHYYATQTVNGCESSARFDVVATLTTTPVPVLNSVALACNQTTVTQIWTAISNIANYRFDVSTDASFATYLAGFQDLFVDAAATSLVVNGLNSNTTYYVRARSVSGSCGISPNSATVTISLPITRTSDGITWDNGTPTDGTKRAVFSGNATITTPLSACSCQINSGVNVVFGVPVLDASYLPDKNADAILKIENELVVLGTLTFENNASLIQVNDNAVNIGDIIYKRVTTPMKNFDFTYWCSPVKDQKLYDLSPNTLWDKYYSYNNGAWKVEAYGVANMDPAKGYAIRVPKPQFWPDPTAATYTQPVQFIGVPNNGSISIATQGANMDNLIGNPYPSPIDADAFILANASLLDGALYFWTHNTAITQSGSFYVYSDSDYAVYTLAGGTGTVANYIDVNNNGVYDSGDTIVATNEPNGKIAAGQSFFVTSTAFGDIVYNNSMRNTTDVLASGSNSQFFRMSKTKKTAAVGKSRVWLNLSNSGGAFKQLLVGYITGATNELDKLYDGISFDGNTYVDFYSVNKENNLTIQGRALPFEETDQIPLGYRTSIEGSFTISIGKTDGVLVNQDIFVEDKVTGTVTNLKNGPYTFSTAIGVFNNRFVLKFIANSTISQSTNKVTSDTADKSVLVLTKNKQVKIKSYDEIIDKVRFYDLKTSLLYEKENVNSKEFAASNFNSREQFLIVKILLKNGKWVTKGIVF